MPETAESSAEIARDRAHIGAFAALGFEHRLVGRRHCGKFQAMDFDRAGAQLYRLAVAREIVGALALDLDRRKARRNLLDGAGEARELRADGVFARARVAFLRDAAFRVVGVALFAP